MADMQRLIAEIQRKLAIKHASYVDKNTNTYKRIPSKNEQDATFTPLYLVRSCLFCIHRKLYFDVCSACRRDKKEAQMRYNLFCKQNDIDV